VGYSEVGELRPAGRLGASNSSRRDVEGDYLVRNLGQRSRKPSGAAPDLQHARVVATAQNSDLALIFDPLKVGRFELPGIPTLPQVVEERLCLLRDKCTLAHNGDSVQRLILFVKKVQWIAPAARRPVRRPQMRRCVD